MLKPIKNFITYLQRNASSTNLFGSPNSSMNADDSLSAESFEDPLTDPLAIEEDFGTLDDGLADCSTNEILGEEITFVDIEKLKGSQIVTPVKKPSELKMAKVEKIEKTLNSITLIKDEDLVDAQNEIPDKNLPKSSETSIEGSGSEIEENFELPPLLDEIRGDGSDSGLGLEISRTAIERDLAQLTPSKSSLKRRSAEVLSEEEPKKPRRSINFGEVKVYYFPRTQGFGCVPSQGGCTLGMTTRHSFFKSFSLSEHLAEQRRHHRQQINELNPSSSSSEDSNSEEEASENSASEADSEISGFLQPISARQRRGLLKAAGIRKIDILEKDDCRTIRTSREVCGCSCRNYCDPDTCECSQAGIKCQVDRLNFPCGCTRDCCANVSGRVEFNPARVKTHFIHTIMRLGLEKKQETRAGQSQIDGFNPAKWPNCEYAGYSYGEPNCHYKATNVAATVPGESLDLHYAYRDEYGASSAADPAYSATNPAYNGPGEYFNYLPQHSAQYPQHYPQNLHHHQMMQNYHANSSQASSFTENGGYSEPYRNYTEMSLNTPTSPGTHEISFPNNATNGSLAEYSVSQHPRLDYPTSSFNLETSPIHHQHALNSNNNPHNSLHNGHSGRINDFATCNNNNNNSAASNANMEAIELGEIAKKGIVETVLA